MKKIIVYIVIGIAIGIIIMQLIGLARIKRIDSYETLFNVVVTTDFINVRTQPTTISKKLFQIIKTEKYQVIDTFKDDPMYMWYKIVFSDRRIGWIASSKENPWVIEIK